MSCFLFLHGNCSQRLGQRKPSMFPRCYFLTKITTYNKKQFRDLTVGTGVNNGGQTPYIGFLTEKAIERPGTFRKFATCLHRRGSTTEVLQKPFRSPKVILSQRPSFVVTCLAIVVDQLGMRTVQRWIGTYILSGSSRSRRSQKPFRNGLFQRPARSLVRLYYRLRGSVSNELGWYNPLQFSHNSITEQI